MVFGAGSVLSIRNFTHHAAAALPPYARSILLANLALGLLLPFLFAIPEPGVPAGMVLFLVFFIGLIGLGYFEDGPDRPLCLTLVLPLAFLVRSALAVFSSFVPITPSLYTLDAEGYDQLGRLVAEAMASGVPLSPALFTSVNVEAYAMLCGAVYYLLGHSLLSMKIINCFAGALMIYNVFRSARALIGSRPALLAAGILTFFPSLVFWSSQNFRDALVFYGISEIVYASIRWAEIGARRWLFRILLAIALTGLLRSSVAAIALAALVLVFIHRAFRDLAPWRRVLAYGAMTAAVVIGFYLFRDSALFPQNLSPPALSTARTRLAAHGATNFPTVYYESWMDVLIYAPYVTAYYLLAPFPWHMANSVQALAALENLLFILFLGLGAAGAVRLWGAQRHRLLFMLLFMAGLSLAAGIVEGNIGTGYRHKMHIIPYVVILAVERQRRTMTAE